ETATMKKRLPAKKDNIASRNCLTPWSGFEPALHFLRRYRGPWLVSGWRRVGPWRSGRRRSRVCGAATAFRPVAIERVTPHGRPEAAQGVQPGLRGCDGETPSCAGLCGGRTRSKSNGFPVVRQGDSATGPARNCLLRFLPAPHPPSL